MAEQESLTTQLEPTDNLTSQLLEPTDNETIMAGPLLSESKHKALVGAFVAFTAIAGYMAATQPSGAGWRLFSWHPFLMVSGFVGMMGSAAVTKKLGGYKNTKVGSVCCADWRFSCDQVCSQNLIFFSINACSFMA